MPLKKRSCSDAEMKEYMLRVRLDNETYKKLIECCKVDYITFSDFIRTVISEKYEQLKK